MEPLFLKETALTPRVTFDFVTHELRIEGRMIPEDIEAAFFPIIDWIEEYLKSNVKLHFLFRLYYYNTSSARQFYLLYKRMDAHFANGKDIFVRWEYEDGDEDCMSDAEEFLKGIRFPNEIVPVTD